MQQALQFYNADHAMVALDPWFLPIIKMEDEKKFHLVRVSWQSQSYYLKKKTL